MTPMTDSERLVQICERLVRIEAKQDAHAEIDNRIEKTLNENIKGIKDRVAGVEKRVGRLEKIVATVTGAFLVLKAWLKLPI